MSDRCMSVHVYVWDSDERTKFMIQFQLQINSQMPKIQFRWRGLYQTYVTVLVFYVISGMHFITY